MSRLFTCNLLNLSVDEMGSEVKPKSDAYLFLKAWH